MVRIHHLPPPAKTARGLGFPRAAGRFLLVPLWVGVCHCRPLCSSGYGHMADSVGAGGAVRGTACYRGFRVTPPSVAASRVPVRSPAAPGLAGAWLKNHAGCTGAIPARETSPVKTAPGSCQLEPERHRVARAERQVTLIS